MSIALVTGGSGDIGEAICLVLSILGYKVLIGYNNSQERAEKTLQKIVNQGGKGETIQLDLSSNSSIKEFINYINRIGEIDVLVNNAGVSNIGLFTDLSENSLTYHMNTNLLGSMNLTKIILPLMIQ